MIRCSDLSVAARLQLEAQLNRTRPRYCCRRLEAWRCLEALLPTSVNNVRSQCTYTHASADQLSGLTVTTKLYHEQAFVYGILLQLFVLCKNGNSSHENRPKPSMAPYLSAMHLLSQDNQLHRVSGPPTSNKCPHWHTEICTPKLGLHINVQLAGHCIHRRHPTIPASISFLSGLVPIPEIVTTRLPELRIYCIPFDGQCMAVGHCPLNPRPLLFRTRFWIGSGGQEIAVLA